MKFPATPRLLLPLLLLALLAGNGCKKALSLIRFQVNDSSTFTIPAVGVVGSPLPLPGVPVSSTSVNTYQSNGTQAGKVQDVTLDELKVTILDPPGQTFDALKSISIDIALDANGTNRRPLASLSNIPAGRTSVVLTPAPNTKLDPYLQNGSYALYVTAELSQPVLQQTRLMAEARYNVSASN